MKKTWSKLLALALALVMCLGMLPVTAMAGEEITAKPTGVSLSTGKITTGSDGKKYYETELSWDKDANYSVIDLWIFVLHNSIKIPLKNFMSFVITSSGGGAANAAYTEKDGKCTVTLKLPVVEGDSQFDKDGDGNIQQANGVASGDDVGVTLQFMTETLGPPSDIVTVQVPVEESGGDTCDHVGTERKYEPAGSGYSFHYVVCAKCNKWLSTEDHVFGDPVKGNGDSDKYTRTCTKCGYVETVTCTHNGTFTYRDHNESTHTKICDICGKYFSEDHRLDNYAYENEQNHFRTCMDCLKRFTEPHTWKRKWPRYEKDGFSYRFYFTQTCKQCGAVAEGYVTGNPFGYRIISGWTDVDEYSALDWMFSKINSKDGMTKDEFENYMAGRYDVDAFSRGWITVVGPLTSLITAMGGRTDMNSMNYIRTCMNYSFLDGKPVKLEVVQTSANNAKNTNQNTNQNVNRNVNSNVVQNSLLRSNGNLSLFQQSVQVNNLRQMTNGVTPEYPFDEDNAQWIDLSEKYTLAYLPFDTIRALEDGEHSITMIFAGEGKNGEEILCPYTVRFEVYSVGEDTESVKNIRNVRPEGEMYCGGANAFLTVAPQEAEYTGSAIEPNATVIAYRRVYEDGAYVIESDTLVEGVDYSLTVYRTDNDATMPVEEIKEVGEYVVVATPVEGSAWKGEAWATFTVTPVESTPSYIGGGTTTYTATLTESPHGRVTVSPTSAAKGETVKITAIPDEGYELDQLTVKDIDGAAVALTDNGDGTWSFTMPGGSVTVSASFVPEKAPIKFADVPEDAWYYDDVFWAADNGIALGTDATHFSPEKECTRAQFMTFLWRAAGKPAPTGTDNPFEDVKAGEYYYDAVLWAVGQGITNGVDEAHFDPEAPVTRAQAVTLLYRYEQSIGKGFTGLWAFQLDYPDAEDVPEWAYEAFCWMVSEDICKGSDGKLLPDELCRRCEVAALLARCFAA